MAAELESAFRLIREVADEQKVVARKTPAVQEAGALTEDAPAHDLSLDEALAIVRAMAHGDDAPGRDPRAIQALYVVTAMLSEDKSDTGSGLPRVVAPGEQRGSVPLTDYLQAIERREIISALEACRYNKTEAARALGLTFHALRYRLELLRIE